MKKIIVMMLAVACAFLLTTSFAVTNDYFAFALPPGYEVINEKTNVGVYKKDGCAVMYGLKSVFDGMNAEVLEYSDEEFNKLIKELYQEPNPIIKSKSVVRMKNTTGIRIEIENPQGMRSTLFFANSDYAIVMLAFYGDVPEEEMDLLLQSFEMRGSSKSAAWLFVIGSIGFVVLLILCSKGKKK